MKRLTALLGAALLAGLALAQTACSTAQAAGPSATLSWILATQNTDGSALDQTTITATRITWRRPGSTVVVGTIDVAAPALTVQVSGLTCGQFAFTAETVVTATVSAESAPPAPYNTGVVCTPNPPSGLSAK